jgi:hypothetical protein
MKLNIILNNFIFPNLFRNFVTFILFLGFLVYLGWILDLLRSCKLFNNKIMN